MIQANELRIGNWILDRGGKQWQIDCWEAPNKVAAKSPYMGELFEKPIYGHPLTEEVEFLQPIPLTPEILEKCGFIMVKEDFWQKLNVTIILTKDGNNLCFVYVEEILNAPKSLHQLQNLYFALTGEELTFKP